MVRAARDRGVRVEVITNGFCVDGVIRITGRIPKADEVRNWFAR